MNALNTFNQWATVFTICAGLIGQGCFVALYSTRGWRKYRITRALMLKSSAFLLIFVLSFFRLLSRGFRSDVNDTLAFVVFQVSLDAIIVIAIYYQLFALVMEVRSGRDAIDAELRTEGD